MDAMTRQPDNDGKAHYLLAEDGRVFQIRPDEKHYFGRADGCLIQLTDDRVSRQHAEVVWNGEAFVVNDLDSTNGTRVNGEPVDVKVLQDGDIVEVGARSFIYRAVRSTMELSNLLRILRRKNVNMDTSEMKGLPVTGGRGEMEGDLDNAPAAELAQFFATSGRTGLLSMHRGSVKAFLYFREGCLAQADYLEAGGADRTGDEAALAALQLSDGHFHFTPDRPPTHPNVKKDIQFLLLDSVRRTDESHAPPGDA